jgi:hypothetical protein
MTSGSGSCTTSARCEANFYEKALFVKPTWRLLLEAECNGFDCPSRYASIRTLGELSLW